MTTTIDPRQIKNDYPNPLDSFRSYSYHFILTLASTTQAFADMIGTKDKPAPLLSAVNAAKAPGEAFTIGSGSTAYLLIDTRRFSQYTITDLEMQHMYGTGDAANPTVPTSAMEMTLLDTTGMTFFNLLMDTFRNKIQTTRSSAFFLLSIIFTGHKDDGTTETIATCNIPLMLLTMGFSLDTKGSTYNISFMEMEGAPSRGAAMEIMNSMGYVKTLTTKGRPRTLGGMIASLEEQLNIQSLGFFQKYSNEALRNAGAGASNLKLGKLVQYMITIPEKWSNFVPSLAGRSRSKELAFIAEGGDPNEAKEQAEKTDDGIKLDVGNDYSQLSFSSTVTIVDAIKTILESSVEFLELASEDRRLAGNAIAFKTIPTVTCDDNTYVVHFDIYPYFLPKIDPAKKEETGNKINAGSKNVIGSANTIQNLMTYNYIFTGKNSHILDMDIKYLPESAVALDVDLDLGKTRFATNAAAGQSKTEIDKASDSSKKKTSSYSPDIRAGDPIFFPLQSLDQQNNATALKNESPGSDEGLNAMRAKQQYTTTYAYIHFLSSIELEMTIRGNPNLLRKFSDRGLRGIAPHYAIVDANAIRKIGQSTADPGANFKSILQQSVASSKSKYYRDYVYPRIASFEKANNSGTDVLIDGPDVSVLPLFCKINILAPNVDFTGDFKKNDDGTSQALFTDEFFFNGPYMVLLITTKFSGGDFTQTLNMIPYDVSGTVTTNDTASTPNKTKVK